MGELQLHTLCVKIISLIDDSHTEEIHIALHTIYVPDGVWKPPIAAHSLH